MRLDLISMIFHPSEDIAHEPRRKNRNIVAAHMTSEQIEKAQALAAGWKPTSQ